MGPMALHFGNRFVPPAGPGAVAQPERGPGAMAAMAAMAQAVAAAGLRYWAPGARGDGEAMALLSLCVFRCWI